MTYFCDKYFHKFDAPSLKNIRLLIALCAVWPLALFGQLKLKGHVVEADGSGANSYGVEAARVTIFQMPENTLVEELRANGLGFFSSSIESADGNYRFLVQKDGFFDLDTVVSTHLRSSFNFSMRRCPASQPSEKTSEQPPAKLQPSEALIVKTDEGEYVEERPYLLPQNFREYSIEVGCWDLLLEYSHPLYKHFHQVFLQKTADGKFCYLIGRDDDLEAIRSFWRKEVQPIFPDSQLCSFRSGAKTYVR